MQTRSTTIQDGPSKEFLLKPMRKIFYPFLLALLITSTFWMAPTSAMGDSDPAYRVGAIRLPDGEMVDRTIIDGPPKPPPGYEFNRAMATLPESNPEAGTGALDVPAFDWSFGCSATSGAMIAAYYDRTGYENIYSGPTNGGVMPLDSSVWPNWTDWNGATYGQCPLTATHQGLDGRERRGSIDDYWVAYDSYAADPYLTDGWTQHAWGEAIGDYMKTSQLAYDNTDGATSFYTWTDSAARLTCDEMVSLDIASTDGTYGRKLFYEARGYSVTDCYNQKTDNNAGDFSFAAYKAEIDAGRPVLLNLAGHSIAGIGYAEPATVYLNDTWDYATHTMTWGGSYAGMRLESVSVVNLQAATAVGSLEGVVANALTEAPIVGAMVNAAGSNQTTSAGEGAYLISLPVGTYNISASAPGYQTETAVEVSILTGGATTLDFNLTPEAVVELNPVALEATLNIGTSATVPLTLTNHGGGLAAFEAQEDVGGYTTGMASNLQNITQPASFTIPEARQAPELAGRSAPTRIMRLDAAMLDEGFESGAVPPAGWSEVVRNHSYNWEVATAGIPHSGSFFANVEFDDRTQDEWLLSPELNLSQAMLSFWSFGSLYWCRDTYDNCDLKVWIVVGAVGGGDDIYLGTADGDWSESWTWAQTTFDLTPLLPGGAVRIGFEYLGNDGAQIALDDVIVEGAQGVSDIPWLTENPISGTIPTAQSLVIEVSFDASGLSQTGLYTGTLHIISNDIANPDQSLPVALHVVDQPMVTQITPDHGPASGGTPVTISGSNFKTGAAVTFGGAAASSVVVVSANQITCETPSHFPETVDVQVTNPDAQSGMLLRGYTYDSLTAAMSLPQANGDQNESVLVPVSLANVEGLMAASLTVSFDPTILQASGASVGELAPGWSLAANTGTPGQVRISMASPGGTVSGSGALATIDFDVVGAPGSSTTLDLSDVLLNDGAIPVQTSNGSFTVDPVYNVSGTIQFWNSGVVSDTIMTLEGENIYTGKSGADGTYQISGVAADDYLLRLEKTNEINGISAYDASLALQHDAGLITLNGHAATAADVNKNKAISSMDAYYILQKSVGLISLPFPGAGVIWSFAPPSRLYTGLVSDLTGQDFTAILLGDPSGNWTSDGLSPMNPILNVPEAVSATLSLPSVDVLPGGTFTVPVSIDLTSAQVFGADFEINYDQAVVTPTQVLKGALAAGWSMVSNLNNPGQIHVAMAGATPIVADGEMLKIVFDPSDQAGLGTDLNLTRGELNEGKVTSALQSGHVHIAHPVQANFSGSPTTGPAPLSVTFSNLSGGDFTTSLWSFGDGSTSNASAPTHDYTAPGVYTVTLTVSGPGGSHSQRRASYIQAYGLKVSGRAQYWAGSAGLPGAGLNLTGAKNYTTSTNSTGVFTISNILAGNYALVPGKGDDVNGITAYDAALVLQHVAGLSSLTGHPASAADVDDSGAIGTMDASYILQKAVGLIDVPFPGSGSVWEFDPPSRSYTSLNSDRTGQDFTGILLGDPSGSWQSGGLHPERNISGTLARLSVQGGLPDATGRLTVTILLDPAGNPITSLDLNLDYDPNSAQIVSVDQGSLLVGWMFAKNLQQPGEIWVGLAGSQPISETGIVITLVFQMEGLFSISPLHISEGLLNEGDVPVELEDGHLGGINVFLPLIYK